MLQSVVGLHNRTKLGFSHLSHGRNTGGVNVFYIETLLVCCSLLHLMVQGSNLGALDSIVVAADPMGFRMRLLEMVVCSMLISRG